MKGDEEEEPKTEATEDDWRPLRYWKGGSDSKDPGYLLFFFFSVVYTLLADIRYFS